MAIIETQPKQAFQKFEKHMVEMVKEVLELPAGTVLSLRSHDTAGNLAFTRGGVETSIPLETNLGTLYLALAQDLTAIREGVKFRLRTRRYAYKLYSSADPRADAIVRWEYDSETDEAAQCRNHMHLDVRMPVGVGRADFNRLHIPTAWVLIEHVLRFLFHDLAVHPRTHEWAKKLRASEEAFYDNFTTKRHKGR